MLVAALPLELPRMVTLRRGVSEASMVQESSGGSILRTHRGIVLHVGHDAYVLLKNRFQLCRHYRDVANLSRKGLFARFFF